MASSRRRATFCLTPPSPKVEVLKKKTADTKSSGVNQINTLSQGNGRRGNYLPSPNQKQVPLQISVPPKQPVPLPSNPIATLHSQPALPPPVQPAQVPPVQPPYLFPQYTPAPLPQGNQAFQNPGQRRNFDGKIPFAYSAENARQPLRENKVFPLPCEVILERLLAGGKITLPEQRLQDLTIVNMSKFCFYHRAYGHETNSCWNLQDVIESMVKAVQLDFDRLPRTASFLREEAQRRRVIDEAVTVARRLAKGKWNLESLTQVGDLLSSRLD